MLMTRGTVLSATLLVCMSLDLLSGQTAEAAWVMEYDRQLSTTISETGFINPIALSLDTSSGELCVTDRGSVSIHILNTHGISTFKTNPYARLSLPTDAVLDPQGGFLFTDSDTTFSRSIKRLDFRGEPVEFQPEEPGPDWGPEHLHLTRDEHIITIDPQQALMCKHDLRTGDLVWQRKLLETELEIRDLVIGSPAEGPNGSIYIPISNLHAVWIYSPDGEPAGSFGVFGSTEGRMVFPAGVGFGQEGTILVLDRMRNKILLYDSQLKFLAEFGSYGLAPGQLYHPRSLAVSPQGQVFISQGFQGRVQAFHLHDTNSSETALLEPNLNSKPNAESTASKPTPRLRPTKKEVNDIPFFELPVLYLEAVLHQVF